MQTTPAAPESEKRQDSAPPLSRSRRWFNWLTYGGIAFAGVFAANIPFTYWFKYGGASKWWEKSAKWLKNRGLSDSASEQILNTGILGVLGNAAIIPIKILEDNKQPIVEKFDAVLGDKPEKENTSPEPSQTWGSLIKSRVAAYMAAWLGFQGAASLFGPERFRTFEESFSKHIVCKPLGRPTHVAGKETKAFLYGKIAALDVFATATAATLLYIGSRIFAKKSGTQTSLPVIQSKQTDTEQLSGCTTCHRKSFTGSMPAPLASYAETAAGEKAKAQEAHIS